MSSQVASTLADSQPESGDHQVGGATPSEYDVFINHRGPDVKLNFVAHLADALREKKIIPFVDKDDLVKGNDAFVAMQSALQAAPILLAIFSPGYAESVHCLNELVAMLECRRKNSNVVLVPVFYDVEPQHLGWLDKGPFKEAFEKHERRALPEVQKWKDALIEARKITGFQLCDMARDENELKRKVIARIEEILNHRMRSLGESVPEPIVGLQAAYDRAVEALERMGDKVAIMGIGGMGGIGKTTLAKKLYNHYLREYDSSTFLKIAGAKDVVELQKQALDDLLQIKGDDAVKKYDFFFQSQLVRHTVLVVIDDITIEEHFIDLLPAMEKLATGSRVIVTSRDLGILKSILKNKPASHLHEMQLLEAGDSFELFCSHAFEEKDLPLKKSDALFPLAHKVAELCSGLPLALEVIGKLLYRNPGERVWDDVIDSLKNCGSEILDKLSISYKALPTCSDKMMFLDICCQMAGLLRDDAIDIWESCKPCYDPPCCTSKSVNNSLSILIGKCLVKVDKDNRLTVHDLLRDMGRDFVEQDHGKDEQPGPLGERSHLWNSRDAKRILKTREGTARIFQGTERIRGLSMIGLKPKNSFDASTFKEMTQIHLLQLDGVRIEGNFSHLSKEIRWLQWRSSFLTNIPEKLQFKYLTVLDLSNSISLTRLWSDGDTQSVPKKLKILRLQNCTALEKIPENVGKLTLLKELNLEGCKKLDTLPGTLGRLTKLQVLNLNGCENLERLPDEIGNLASLERFLMNGCSKITKLPEAFGNLGALVIFNAEGASSLSFLPRSFSRMSHLEELSLCDCHSLSELPKSIGGLVKLRVLRANGTALKELPQDFGDLASLVELILDNCNFLQGLPESFGRLKCLKYLMIKKCQRLRKLSINFGQLQNLTMLHLDECPIEDGDLPDSFGGLTSLSSLCMRSTKISTLPESFSDLTALIHLTMQECRDLVHVQSLPAYLEDLDLGNCFKLNSILVLEKLTKLKTLILCNCIGLTSIQGLENMSALEELNVSGCSNLVEICSDLLLNPAMKRCFLSGSKTVWKYNNNWAQEFPSSQVVSYYDHSMGFVENMMAEKVSSVENADELCMETTISSEKSIEAIIIVVVAHDQGWSDGYYAHGRYNHEYSNLRIEARIIRSGEDVYAIDRLITVREADHRDQVYICTLRKSYPVTKQLRQGDKLCVYARSRFLRWAITVMQGAICVAHEEQDHDLRATFGDLYLRDGMSKSFGLWPSDFFQASTQDQLYVEAVADPSRSAAGANGDLTDEITDENSGDLDPATQVLEYCYGLHDHLPTSSIVRRRLTCLPVIAEFPVEGIPERGVLTSKVLARGEVICDGCETVISKVGWYCKNCESLDLCENCHRNPESVICGLHPHHNSDHPREALERPCYPVDNTAQHINWGYLISVDDENYQFCSSFSTPTNIDE